jgi:hypothetical protein
MLPVFAKIRAPLAGWGQAKLILTRKFKKLSPEAQMSILNQVMRQCRDAHKEADRKHRSNVAHEHARDAEAIRARA